MKPIPFKGSNVTFAKNQPEYLPLPALRAKDGTVISCWKMGIRERFKVLFTGRVWLSLLTFNQPLQPQQLVVDYPFNRAKGRLESSFRLFSREMHKEEAP